jgi:hypothetical protein
LDEEQQLAVLNMEENFVLLSPTANQSKGAKTFEEWLEHAETGTKVNAQFRADMMALEKQLEEIIKGRIYILGKEKLARLHP